MHRAPGFTIVELIIVIVVIGILAGVVTVSYGTLTKRGKETSLQSDLATAAKRMHVAFNQEGRSIAFPDSIPSDFQPSKGNVLQLAYTGEKDRFCINGYGPTPDVRLSYESKNSLNSPLFM